MPETSQAPAKRTTTEPTQSERSPRIGLALGGGGARGLAHLLMLEVFDELKIKPHVIAGTSIGAIFGAGYASGLTASQIRAHCEELLLRRSDMIRQLFAARNEPIQRVLNIFQLRSALLNPEALLELVMPKRTAATFEDLEIPLRIIAADYYTQDQVVFDRGALRPAVAASMALPALFAPVITDDPDAEPMALMDGGLVNPLPFDVISPEVDITVAIDVSGAGRTGNDRKPPRAVEALVASSQIMQNSLVREKLKSRTPDILIDVEVGQFHVLEFHKLKSVLDAAAPAKEQLRMKLERVLSAETLEAIDPPTSPSAKPEARGNSQPPVHVETTKPKRLRLAQRILHRDDAE